MKSKFWKKTTSPTPEEMMQKRKPFPVDNDGLSVGRFESQNIALPLMRSAPKSEVCGP